ncbi:hypothetical protein CSOJ01_07035 [Colletotrichum sojae]|uniref:Uncharacterized protein n=1 Tax=Colletotrichum sojae TaxID=2175907 RepID=A0A8H6MUA3_9PEZI|nr:hypothetical protein CSOJ01_07035 [Colletotrichum sojae]
MQKHDASATAASDQSLNTEYGGGGDGASNPPLNDLTNDVSCRVGRSLEAESVMMCGVASTAMDRCHEVEISEHSGEVRTDLQVATASVQSRTAELRPNRSSGRACVQIIGKSDVRTPLASFARDEEQSSSRRGGRHLVYGLACRASRSSSGGGFPAMRETADEGRGSGHMSLVIFSLFAARRKGRSTQPRNSEAHALASTGRRGGGQQRRGLELIRIYQRSLTLIQELDAAMLQEEYGWMERTVMSRSHLRRNSSSACDVDVKQMDELQTRIFRAVQTSTADGSAVAHQSQRDLNLTSVRTGGWALGIHRRRRGRFETIADGTTEGPKGHGVTGSRRGSNKSTKRPGRSPFLGRWWRNPAPDRQPAGFTPFSTGVGEGGEPPNDAASISVFSAALGRRARLSICEAKPRPRRRWEASAAISLARVPLRRCVWGTMRKAHDQQCGPWMGRLREGEATRSSGAEMSSSCPRAQVSQIFTIPLEISMCDQGVRNGRGMFFQFSFLFASSPAPPVISTPGPPGARQPLSWGHLLCLLLFGPSGAGRVPAQAPAQRDILQPCRSSRGGKDPPPVGTGG